jgi:hypothetical protein
MRVLSAQEADSLGLNDEAPKGQRILSPEEAKSLGLDDDGPRPDLFKAAGDAMPAATDTILSGARGLLDMVPFSHRFIAGVQGEPVEAVDQRYEATKEEHPAAFRTGQVASLLLPGPKGIKGLAALGGLQAAGDSRGGFSDAVKDAGFGAVLGGTLGLAGKGVAAAAGLGAKALPYLERLEAKYAGIVGDKAVKGAEETANSAMGSYRSSRADANRILDLLEKPSGDAGTDAAAQAFLNSPQGKALRLARAKGAIERAPEALNNVDSLKTLADETHAAIPAARAAATSDEGLQAALRQRTKDQLGRYAIPAVTGAVGTAMAGPLGGGLGAAAGRGVSPGIRAVVLNNILAPERKVLMSRTGISVAKSLAGMANSQPQALGKFAAPLARAFERGDDAVAATHFVLSQDPDYQQLVQATADQGGQ